MPAMKERSLCCPSAGSLEVRLVVFCGVLPAAHARDLCVLSAVVQAGPSVDNVVLAVSLKKKKII